MFKPDSKRNIIIKYIAERKWDELQKRKDEIEKENARYIELQNTRIRHAQGSGLSIFAITTKILRILTERIDPKDSLDSKL